MEGSIITKKKVKKKFDGSVLKVGGLSKSRIDAIENGREKRLKEGKRTNKEMIETRDGVLRVMYKRHGWTIWELVNATGLTYMNVFRILKPVLTPQDSRRWNRFPYPESETDSGIQEREEENDNMDCA